MQQALIRSHITIAAVNANLFHYLHAVKVNMLTNLALQIFLFQDGQDYKFPDITRFTEHEYSMNYPTGIHLESLPKSSLASLS